MFRSEKGITRVRLVILWLAIIIITAMTIRVMVGENGLIQQWKEERNRKDSENNIVIELTNSTN